MIPMTSLLIYTLAAVASYLGLVAGIIVGWLAEEELAPGRRYITLIQNAILSGVLFSLIYFAFSTLAVAIVSAVILFVIMSVLKKKVKSYAVYAVLGAVFYFSAVHETMFALNASLIFIYGIPSGSLVFKRKGWLVKLGTHLGFLAVALGLPAVIH
jgi:hypothetical protein